MKQKNILVTGASRGLGFEVARELWNRGANLALVARHFDQYLPARAGQEMIIMSGDLLNPIEPERLIRQLQSKWERLDGLVNNAGIVGPIGPVWENDWQMWQQTIQLNLLAPVNLCRLCVNWMGTGGSIVNISGGGATSPRPNFSAYATAKSGLVRFTENLAEEVAGMGIRVNAVAPGAMNTEMLEMVIRSGEKSVGKEYKSAVKQRENGGVPPAIAAALIAYMLSSESQGVTGRLISAVWDPWQNLSRYRDELQGSDIYTLRRITPGDRDKEWL